MHNIHIYIFSKHQKTWVWIPRSRQNQDKVVWAQNVQEERWEAKTGGLPESCRPARMAHVLKNRTCGKVRYNTQGLFFELHTCTMACLCRHSHIWESKHTQDNLNYEKENMRVLMKAKARPLKGSVQLVKFS